MSNACERFYSSLPDEYQTFDKSLVDTFIYFLTLENSQETASAKSVQACFENCDLPIPGRIPQYLSEGLKGARPKFVKARSGYRLSRHRRDEIKADLGNGTVTMEIQTELRALEAEFSEGPRKKFLSETIDCLEVGATRATIVMCWIFALDQLIEFIILNKLVEFNEALQKNRDKRIKIKSVTCRDDFDDIPESAIIELCRAAKIISGDVKKILDQKLGVRNTAAHPSSVGIKPSKVVDFVEDLIENVALKYKT